MDRDWGMGGRERERRSKKETQNDEPCRAQIKLKNENTANHIVSQMHLFGTHTLLFKKACMIFASTDGASEEICDDLKVSPQKLPKILGTSAAYRLALYCAVPTRKSNRRY